MVKIIDDKEMQQIIQDIQNGMTREDIAKKYHHSTKTIRRNLERYGIKKGKPGRTAILTKEQRAECKKLHQEGATPKELSEMYKVDIKTMKIALGTMQREDAVTNDWAKEWDEARIMLKKIHQPAGVHQRRLG